MNKAFVVGLVLAMVLMVFARCTPKETDQVQEPTAVPDEAETAQEPEAPEDAITNKESRGVEVPT